MLIKDYLPPEISFDPSGVYLPMGYDYSLGGILFNDTLELFIDELGSGYILIAYVDKTKTYENRNIGDVSLYYGINDKETVIKECIKNFNYKIGDIKEFSDTRIKRNLILKDLL